MRVAHILVVLAVAAFASAKLFPPAAQWKICDDIGRATGCSGCSNNLTGCEWCALNVDEGRHEEGHSNCAPEGFCADLPTTATTGLIVEAVYGPGNHLCPADPEHSTEPIFHGSQVNIPEESLHTGFLAPHFCDFPKDPWAIDRTVNYYGETPVKNCHDFNYHTYLGDRSTVEDTCKVDLDVPRNQECLKLIQSFQCTSACPEYGHPARYNKVCYEDCQRVEDTCNNVALCSNGNPCPFFDCIAENAVLQWECAARDDKDCYHITPDLIPASSKFESEYCLGGFTHGECNRVDCKVLARATVGYFGDHCDCCGRHNDVTYGITWLETQTAPFCIYGNSGTSDVGITWDILRKAENNGRQCEEVIDKILQTKWTVDGYALDCNHEIGQCSAYVYLDFGETGVPSPTWCDASNEGLLNNVPDQFNCLVYYEAWTAQYY